MTFLRKLFLKFIHPTRIFCAFAAIACLGIMAGSVLCIIFVGEHPAVYALYALAVAAFLYLIYLILLGLEKFKPHFLKLCKKHRFTTQLIENHGFRTVVFAGFAALLNVSYGVYNAVLGAVNLSVWYASLAAYFMLLATLRGSIILKVRKIYIHMVEGSFEREEYVVKNYRRTGIWLLVLSLALSAAVVQVVLFDNSFEQKGMLIYVFAAYTVYKVTMAIINSVKMRRRNDFTAQSIRNIGLADALVSILALQTAMLTSFGNGANVMIPNALTGAAVIILNITLGVYMICRAQKHLNLLKRQ